MPDIIMTRGLPASGKSTWAKKLVDDNPGKYKRVNKDDLRAMLDNGRWSKSNENFVLEIRDTIVRQALLHGQHVIVDDTNGHPKHQAQLEEIAASFRSDGKQCDVVVKDFTDVSVEECIKRDLKRPNSVGEKVIRDMYQQFFAPPVVKVEYDPSLPDCIICDIDGTVALMNGRGPFEWNKVGSDLSNLPVTRVVMDYLCKDEGPRVLLVSGRDEVCRKETTKWYTEQVLDQCFGRATRDCYLKHDMQLFMRPAGDQRDDRVVKREIYEQEIKGKYNVLFVLDDRDKVVKQWREMGLTCFQVAEGNF